MKKKFRGLLVPWFVFSNIIILAARIMTFKENNHPSSEVLWNLCQIRGVHDGMWFVAALFIAFIPFYFIVKWEKPIIATVLGAALYTASMLYTKYVPGDIFPWGVNSLPWHLEYIGQALLWMLLGYYFRSHLETGFDRFNTRRNRFFVWVVYLILAYIPQPSNAFSVLLSCGQSLLGIVAVVALCKTICSNRYVSFVGSNTLLYFAFHGKLLSLIEHALRALATGFYTGCLSNSYASSVLAIVLTIIMSFVLIIPAWITNKWFPWLLGRTRSK